MCVIDSDWIDVTPLTVVVGKNESGKTALLKALHLGAVVMCTQPTKSSTPLNSSSRVKSKQNY